LEVYYFSNSKVPVDLPQFWKVPGVIGLPDADLVEKNIKNHIIRVTGKVSSVHLKGDQALIEIFKRGQYDLISTDDAKLTRLLKSMAIPYILPGLVIRSLYQRGIINKATALNWLEKLSSFIRNAAKPFRMRYDSI